MMISVQHEDFDFSREYQLLRENSADCGAIVTFTGLVRDFCQDGNISCMTLEHYPGMTEKSLMDISSEARRRWDLGDVRIIHRVGTLEAKAQIVFIGVSSRHRKDAFEAAEFLIDYLKTRAPFWKKEHLTSGERWVESKTTDLEAAKRWSRAAT
ncbi:MAG: molybdopterin synthase catalytic subunit MoaE [Aestuariibacter sp.]